jgi:hypothetical protein
VSRSLTRLAAAALTLTLALPLAAVAGCGVEKKRTIKAEFSSAQQNLLDSKAVSFTLRLKDPKGAIGATVLKKDEKALTGTVLASSITVTIDPTGAQTLAELSASTQCSATKPADLSASLKKVNLGIAVADGSSTLGELRLIDGSLYAHVDLKEIGAIAKDAGVDDFDSKVDDAVSGADPKLAEVVSEAREGKWLSLPLAKYLDKFQDLAKSFTSQLDGASPAPSAKACADTKGLSKDLFGALKPYVKVTDANDSSSDRVLDINVKARPALKAALNVLKAAKGLPFGSLFSSVQPTDIDDNVADGTAKGTITLRSGHLTQLAVDIESIRTLNPDAGKESLAGSRVVLDVNDDAGALTAPSGVSTIDLGAIIDDFLSGLDASSSETTGTYAG